MGCPASRPSRTRTGRWGGGTYQPKWTSTTNTLALLRDLGLDPASERASNALSQVREKVKWNDHPDAPWADNPYFVGEVEPCINARVVAIGSYFGEDVQGLVNRLLGEQLPDGGWNCEAENGSTRSSFHTTINVLEGFLEHERATGTTETAEARMRGQEYLLERRLFHRLSTGEVVDPAWTYFFFPTWWHYDVLRGLDYCAAPVSLPMSGAPRRSSWSRRDVARTGDGPCSTRTPVRFISTSTMGRVSPAAGSLLVRCASSIGRLGIRR